MLTLTINFQIRHTTANMQFDEYVTRELSGGAHKDTAYLAGHDKSTQLKVYTDEYKKIGVAGFKKLEQLANDELLKNEDVVRNSLKSVRLLQK